MKLTVVLASLCVAGASQILTSIQSRIHSKSQQISNLKQITIKETDLAGSLAQDVKSHQRVKGVRAVQLMPEPGNCGLHWDLCPNMCNLNETLMNNFAEIVGNKMTKYQEWKQDTAEKKRAIIKDLEGKLDQVSGLEDLLKKNGLDLEKREELFIALLEDHIAQSLALKERLAIINADFGEIEIELTSLSGKIDAAHTDCYEQAPCMAVPQCKLGVASGTSCQDIAEKAMDTDEQGDPTLNKENGVSLFNQRVWMPRPLFANLIIPVPATQLCKTATMIPVHSVETSKTVLEPPLATTMRPVPKQITFWATNIFENWPKALPI